jgi:hypothetical protein
MSHLVLAYLWYFHLTKFLLIRSYLTILTSFFVVFGEKNSMCRY